MRGHTARLAPDFAAAQSGLRAPSDEARLWAKGRDPRPRRRAIVGHDDGAANNSVFVTALVGPAPRARRNGPALRMVSWCAAAKPQAHRRLLSERYGRRLCGA